MNVNSPVQAVSEGKIPRGFVLSFEYGAYSSASLAERPGRYRLIILHTFAKVIA